jgi:hypothetical protein
VLNEGGSTSPAAGNAASSGNADGDV